MPNLFVLTNRACIVDALERLLKNSVGRGEGPSGLLQNAIISSGCRTEIITPVERTQPITSRVLAGLIILVHCAVHLLSVPFISRFFFRRRFC